MGRPARKSPVDPRIHKDSSLKEGLGKVIASRKLVVTATAEA
jgi:hypothetical protein